MNTSVQQQAAAQQRDYFQLYQLEPVFDLDLEDLAARYRKLQRHFHPDRTSGSSAAEQRVAAQMSAEVNAAFQTLKDPVKRAGYLLERRGVDLGRLGREPVAPEFLMEQMELREAIESLSPSNEADRKAVSARAEQMFNDEIEALRVGLRDDDEEQAGAAWVHMLYLDKLRSEIARGDNNA